MDLAYDHALGTVDDKGASLGHERNVADVDVLLPDLAGFLEDEVDPCLYRHRVGQPLLLALSLAELDVVLVEHVVAVLENHVAIGTLDREHRLEHFLEALNVERFALLQHLTLQEALIRGELDIYQVRQIHDLLILLPDIYAFHLGSIQHCFPLIRSPCTSGTCTSGARVSGTRASGTTSHRAHARWLDETDMASPDRSHGRKSPIDRSVTQAIASLQPESEVVN